ncbi:peroxidase 55-like [Argentina anserina]|uniref:peroxidase 55-like n=1 Tax=Argentina anserina TaxID=57926 RepID=UPI0021765156|nr:peroxidase 55-like [Potentilla anserina]
MEVGRGLLLIVVMVLMMIDMQGCGSQAQLVENFYSSSCPNVESIVKQAVSKKFSQTFTTIPATLRLFFHDCFVEGCDASVMISSPNGDAEKDSSDNLSLAGDGFDTVIKAKQAVEAQCPGVVSCADILALATCDVVVLGGGPDFNVELGRRDGLVSKASRVAGNLPEPEFDLKQLNTMFSKHSLTQTDVIALSGAHTLGFSHCDHFANRLYSFSSSSAVDPSLDPDYAPEAWIKYARLHRMHIINLCSKYVWLWKVATRQYRKSIFIYIYICRKKIYIYEKSSQLPRG